MKVWREGNRVRREDGAGYGDMVSDDVLRDRANADRATAADRLASAEFCEAVLAFRAGERSAVQPASPTQEG